MAKKVKAKKARRAPVSTSRLPEPPSGGREVKTGGSYNFWNPSDAGDTIEGTLAGVVMIKNQKKEDRKRYTLLVEKKLYVLPDHLNLMRLMEDVENNNQSALGIRVWIQYLGKKEIENVAVPMAQYRVVDYGKTDDKDVPF